LAFGITALLTAAIELCDGQSAVVDMVLTLVLTESLMSLFTAGKSNSRATAGDTEAPAATESDVRLHCTSYSCYSAHQSHQALGTDITALSTANNNHITYEKPTKNQYENQKRDPL